MLVGVLREEHQILSVETVQRPEESPVELLDLDGKTMQREEELLDPIGGWVPDLTGGGAMRRPDPGSGGL